MTAEAVEVNLGIMWSGWIGTPIRPKVPRKPPRGKRRPEPSFSRLWWHVKALTPEALEAGRRWYPEALWRLRGMAEAHGLPVSVVVAAAATLTPGIRWERALWLLRAQLDALSIGAPMPLGGDAAFGYRDRIRAWKILTTGDLSHCRGPKVQFFRRALAGDTQAVVVDRHLVRLATGSDLRQATPVDMERIRVSLRTIGWALREDPAALQAALWSLKAGT